MKRYITFLFVLLLGYGCTSPIYQIKYYPDALRYVKLKPSAVTVFVEYFEDERTLQERNDLSLHILFAEGNYDRYFIPPSQDLVREAIIEEINTTGIAKIVSSRRKADYVIDGALLSFKKDLKVGYYPMWAETFNPGYTYDCDIYINYTTALTNTKSSEKIWEKSFVGHYERKNKALYLFHWPVVLARGCQEALSQAISANIAELAYVLENLENKR